MSDDLPRLDWTKLLSDERLPKDATGGVVSPAWLVNSRTEAERDFDRILYATPTRRLGDKTQVFPLERNESVRTRLTHSHEVANLARSIGTHLVNGRLGELIKAEAGTSFGADFDTKVRRAIPAMLAAIGLAHDLGNPPFGHQGEEAIRFWMIHNDPEIFSVSERQQCKLGEEGRNRIVRDLEGLTRAHREDFRGFEGNAQTLRTLSKLQIVKDDRGLNLTFATLAASMKYTVPSDQVVPKKKGISIPPSVKKFGYFSSEAGLVEQVRRVTGLSGHLRHPLTYIMEACDDICYLIVDAEDAVKKQIVSFHDLKAWLDERQGETADELTKWVLETASKGCEEARAAKLPPTEVNDVSMQVFRTNAITAMVSAVIRAFESHYETIMTTGLPKPLLDLSDANRFAGLMSDFDFQHAYKHRRVLEIELAGFNTIQGLMDLLWRGIVERASFEEIDSLRTTPFARYAYGRISENYRRVFRAADPGLPIRYRELQLLTDMMAGMTDQFAIDLYGELQGFHVGASAS